MKKTIILSLVMLFAFFSILIMSNCGGGGGGVVPTPTPTPTTPPGGYTLSGVLKDLVTKNPISGATVKLYSETVQGSSLIARDYYYAETTTLLNGSYIFTGIPAGNYSIEYQALGYITFILRKIPIYNNMEDFNQEISNEAEWNEMAGEGHHYDSSVGYVGVGFMEQYGEGNPSISGVSAYINPSTGISIGYITDDNHVDWNATATTSQGIVIFAGLNPQLTYSINAEKAGYTFQGLPIENVSAQAGVFEFYPIFGSNPLTPTPAPTELTPTQTPGVPTPTQTPASNLTFTGEVTNLQEQPISGVNVQLMDLQIPPHTLDTKTTGADGVFTFTGLLAGDYRIRFTHTDYPPMNKYIHLEESENWTNMTFPSNTDCEQIFGSAPNENYGYIIGEVYDVQNERPLSGVEMNLTPNTYQIRGYLEENEQTHQITFNSQSSVTLNMGIVIFYGVTLGQTYTLTPAKSGYTFEPANMSNISVFGGELVELPSFKGTQQ